jgi:hypothetical protein
MAAAAVTTPVRPLRQRVAFPDEVGALKTKCAETREDFGASLFLAEWTGLEPATPGVTGRYSNQLNYHSTWLRIAVSLDTHQRIKLIRSRDRIANKLASPRGFEPL